MLYAEFATKLRPTAAALGCANRKAFCARFRAVNPATPCDVDRLHKWMQGRALPRSSQFYEDWRRVIGSDRPASWLEASTVDAFAEELSLRTGVPASELQARERSRQRSNGDGAPAILGAERTLHGAFACYSHAWSPRCRGKLIRGSMRIGPGRSAAGLRVLYAEALSGGTIRLPGDASLAGGMMHVLLREGEKTLPLFLSLIVLGPPASVLCGVLAGPTLVAHETLPTATRFAAVRVPESEALDLTNRYMDVDGAAIAADLGRLGLTGLGPDSAEQLGAAMVAFLGEGADQVMPADQLTLCGLLDGASLSPGGIAPSAA